MAQWGFGLALHSRKEAGSTVLELRGELDMDSAPRLETALSEIIERGERRIIVDLTALDFMDSQGLNALITAYRRLGPDGEMVLRSPTRLVRSLLRVSGLDRLLTVEDGPAA